MNNKELNSQVDFIYNFLKQIKNILENYNNNNFVEISPLVSYEGEGLEAIA